MHKTQLFQYLTIAQASINNAIEHLQTIGTAHGDYSEEANYYAACLRELLSSDNDCAGLDTLVRNVRREVER